jgi:hypothetical protein
MSNSKSYQPQQGTAPNYDNTIPEVHAVPISHDPDNVTHYPSTGGYSGSQEQGLPVVQGYDYDNSNDYNSGNNRSNYAGSYPGAPVASHQPMARRGQAPVVQERRGDPGGYPSYPGAPVMREQRGNYGGSAPVLQGYAHNGPDVGTCRRCGRQFERPPGDHRINRDTNKVVMILIGMG